MRRAACALGRAFCSEDASGEESVEAVVQECLGEVAREPRGVSHGGHSTGVFRRHSLVRCFLSRLRSQLGAGHCSLPTPRQRTCGPERPRGPVASCDREALRQRPLLGRPFSRTPFSRTHTHARARTHACARTTDDERRDVRSAGVADWKTSRGGNTELTLTA